MKYQVLSQVAPTSTGKATSPLGDNCYSQSNISKERDRHKQERAALGKNSFFNKLTTRRIYSDFPSFQYVKHLARFSTVTYSQYQK